MGRRSERRTRLAAERRSLASKSSCTVFLLKFCDFHGISLKPCWQTRTEAEPYLPASSRLASAARPTVHRFARKQKQKLALLEYHLVEKPQNLGATTIELLGSVARLIFTLIFAYSEF